MFESSFVILLMQAITLQLGYNAALVAVGAAALGIAAGATGSFMVLRKRALVSDAVSHATLPGLALAFLVMVALGGDGRSLAGLMLGAACSAWIGLVCVGWLVRHTRLPEDAAIGAVLSVFFGLGIVLLTVIQSVPLGRASGLEGFLLGATAGMLRSDAILIAVGGVVILGAALVLRRPMMMTAFDPGHAETQGIPLGRVDLAMMTLVMAITVVGLKIVGLILIVALLIIPAVTARFWTDRSHHLVGLSALFGGVAGYSGAALSAAAPNLPTGPIIVLVSFGLFALSLLFAPGRGAVAGALRHRRHQHQVHLRQGLMALADQQPIYERLTRRMLRRAGYVRRDGVTTQSGAAAAAHVRRDEARWRALRAAPGLAELANRDDGLTDIETVLTADQLSDIDRRLGSVRGPVQGAV